MSENPSAILKFLNQYHIKPWMAAVIGASIGFFLVCFGFWLPFSPTGIDPVTKELKLGGNLDNWRANAGFLFLVAFCIFAGLALMFASIQLVRGEERRSQRDRQLVYGLNTVVGTVLVLIVLAVINLLAFTEPVNQMLWRAFSRDFDWTKGTMYTLSPGTITYLNELQEPVKAYAFMDAEPGSTEMTTLLRSAQTHSKKFTWERLSLVPRPDARAIELIRKYQLKEPRGGVLLIAGDEGGKHDHEFIPNDKIARQDFDRMGRPSRNVTFSGENALRGTLQSLLEGQVVVYFTQGHGEPSLDGGMPKELGMPRAAGGLSKLRSKLTENRRKFEVKPLTLDKGLTKVPEDATAVVIVRPAQPLGDHETKVLGDYLARKGETNTDKTVKVAPGRLIVLLDPIIRKEAGGAVTFAPTGLETFLAGYGVRLPNERIQIAIGPDPLRITTIIKPDPQNPLSAAFNEMDAGGRLVDFTEFPMENVRVVQPIEGAKGPYKADMLMMAASQGMWVEKELGIDPGSRAAAIRGDAALRKALLIERPVSAAVSVSTSGGPPKMPGMPDDAAHGGGKEQPLMVVFGSASWVSDEGLTGRSGALRGDLFSSTLSWLRGQGEMGKFVDDKVNQEYELNVPPQNMARLYLLPLVLMVLGVTGLGIGVWVVRRR